MGKIDLKKGEVILKRDSNILHDRGRMRDGWGDELVLTNKALIVVHKGIFSSEPVRFPLGRIRVVNGLPQVTTGVSENGKCQLHVFFPEGAESFTLGDADEDSELSLRNIFTPTSEKERQNLESWRDAISSATLRFRTEYEAEQRKAEKKAKRAEPPAPPRAEDVVVPVTAGASTGSASSMASQDSVTTSLSEPSQSSRHEAQSVSHATRRCIGCMAPITGVIGEKVTCRYCDTVQVIS